MIKSRINRKEIKTNDIKTNLLEQNKINEYHIKSRQATTTQTQICLL